MKKQNRSKLSEISESGLENFRATGGVDPGVSGAMAVLVDGRFARVADFGDPSEALALASGWISEFGPIFWAVESVHSMPRQGVKSTWTFAQNFGWWLGVLDALRQCYVLVTPRVWQARVGVGRKLHARDKPGLELARKLYPEAPLKLKRHHGRADALLLARWAWLEIGGGR